MSEINNNNGQVAVASVQKVEQMRKPEWLKVRAAGGEKYREVKSLMKELTLHTVCQEALCPNIGECWEQGTATIMLLGSVCTRGCTFCDIARGKPVGLDLMEPFRVAQAIQRMGLEYAVLTSVTRDDLEDGGAEIFARTVREIKKLMPATQVEVLIPDFRGSFEALKIVVEAKPDVLNHNMETIERLYPQVRKGAKYYRSLELLDNVKKIDPKMVSKSGIMVGLGEELEEIRVILKDLRKVNCDLLTIGQYLRPSNWHIPVVRYYHPEEFENLKHIGLDLGFKHVESGPLVRSSYHAKKQAAVISSQPLL